MDHGTFTGIAPFGVYTRPPCDPHHARLESSSSKNPSPNKVLFGLVERLPSTGHIPAHGSCDGADVTIDLVHPRDEGELFDGHMLVVPNQIGGGKSGATNVPASILPIAWALAFLVPV